jgi:hypothetical protein
MSSRVSPCRRTSSAVLGGRRGHLPSLVGGDQTRLRLEPSDISRGLRVPQPINEGSRAYKFRIAVNHDQCCIRHTVSASILSYSA